MGYIFLILFASFILYLFLLHIEDHTKEDINIYWKEQTGAKKEEK